jgi:hypothetical protein
MFGFNRFSEKVGLIGRIKTLGNKHKKKKMLHLLINSVIFLK